MFKLVESLAVINNSHLRGVKLPLPPRGIKPTGLKELNYCSEVMTDNVKLRKP